MSVDNLPPGVGKENQVAHPRRRLTELERRSVGASDGPAVTLRPCVFSFPGTVVGFTRSGKWKNKNGDSFTLATITCVDPGSTVCDVDILVNGSVLFTVSLAAGADYAEFPAAFAIGSTDVIQVESGLADGGQTEVTVLIE